MSLTTYGSPIGFACYFRDCYNAWYRQTIQVWLLHSITPDTPPDQAALNVSIQSARVTSAPTEIAADDLPWHHGASICFHALPVSCRQNVVDLHP